MTDMPNQPAHAKPGRPDLIWVLVLIAACGLLEVWASWLQIGSVSGFPKLGAMTTGWILPVTTEAYWTAALYAWLVAPAGPRSKSFAMWSAAGVFLLSLAGQESDHLLAAAHRAAPPVWVVGFVTALPLIAVALIAVLIHLRHLDQAAAGQAAADARAAAAETQREVAEAAELDALRAQLEHAEEALGTAQADRAEALRAAQEATVKAEAAARKLAARAGSARPRSGRTGKRAADPRSGRADESATEVPSDVDAQAEALSILAAEPGISGAQLGPRVGKSKRWGQDFKKNLAASAARSEGSGQETP